MNIIFVGLMLVFFWLAISNLAKAGFVLLGFWEDDDGAVRWHPDFVLFVIVCVLLIMGIVHLNA